MAGISAYDTTPVEDFIVMCPEVLDLDGTDVTYEFYPVPTRPTWGNDNNTYSLVIKEFIILYTEGTAAAGSGSNLRLGKNGASTAYHSYDTLDSQSAGDVVVILNTIFTGEDRVLTTDKSIQVRNLGTLGAAGECRIGVKLSRRYDQFKDFDGYGI